MSIHFIFLAIIFLLTLLYKRTKEKNHKILSFVILFTIFILLAAFTGMRDISIGTDTKNYVAMHTTGKWVAENIEFALPIISHATHIFTNKYFVFLIILSIISIIGIIDVLKKNDFNIEIFIYLYITSFCYIYSTSATRFFCAFSIIMLSFKYIIENKKLKAILIILLAMLFHTSAIIFIPIIFITRFKFTKRNLTIFFISLAVATIMIEVFGSYFFNIGMFQKYSYIEEATNTQIGPSIIINSILLMVSLLFYNKITDYKGEYEFSIKMLIISMFIDLIGIAYRAIWYFRFPAWFIIPIILVNIRKTDKKTYLALYALTIIMYGCYYYFMLKVSIPSHKLLNYSFNTGFN